ncbi:activator-dependent family glycosyltransferase [Streptomyces sp. NPDC021093]|uniref:activator-dependent family glycosyltransferase n=1 Tax=Streptomyces sp. NPDC021093 TaxID=3365112 RepID=UPI0037A93BF5
MRVLIAAPALDAHFNGCVPLAWALRTAGHEVRVASQPPLTESITTAGLTAVPVGHDPEIVRVMADAGPRIYAHHEGHDLMNHQDPSQEREFLRASSEMLTEAFYSRINSEQTVDDLVAVCRDWQPDLVLWETFTFGGAIAARVAGIPHARVLWGPDLFLHMRTSLLGRLAQDGVDPARTPGADPLRDWATGQLARHGLDFTEETVTGQWRIDQMPASMRLAPGQSTLTMRYVPYNGPGPATVPSWLRGAPERPRICLTTGLSVRTIDSPDGRAVTTGDFFEAVAGLDAEVVAILGEAERARLTSVPDNIRVVDFTSLHVLLPTCSAIVHHGGAGTWGTAAIHGVPQIVLASMWDNVHRARRTQELGAGIFLPPAELTPALLRTSLDRVLYEPSFAKAAQELRTEIVAEPSPNDLVAALERMTAEHTAQR